MRITKLTSKEEDKVKKDLMFVDLVTRAGKEMGLRVVVFGGYAVDGLLGELTRPHQDLDLLVHVGTGRKCEELVIKLLAKIEEEPMFGSMKIEDKGRSEFYHSYFVEGNGIGVDMYWIEVVEDVWGVEKTAVKADGSWGDKRRFRTLEVELEGVEFEANNAFDEMVDRMYKNRKKGYGRKEKYDQDIENLSGLVEINVAREKVRQMLAGE